MYWCHRRLRKRSPYIDRRAPCVRVCAHRDNLTPPPPQSPLFVQIAYVGHEIVDQSSVSDAIAGQTLFIHGSGVQDGSRASVEAVRRAEEEKEEKKSLSPRRNLRNLREGGRRLQDTTDDM